MWEESVLCCAKTNAEDLDTNPLSSNAMFRLEKPAYTAPKAACASTRNEFFDTPQPVSSFYTGREDLLQKLHSLLVAPVEMDGEHGQLRFVIHGMGGSGKTQFCCKFAELNRER